MNNRFNKNSFIIIIGVLLVIFGIWQLLERVFGTFYFEVWRVTSIVLSILWPVAIIVGGITLMVAARKGKLEISGNKKLYRSTKNKKLAGVCGGIAEYFNTDPAMVRVIAIILVILAWHITILLYVLFWIIIPQNDAKNYNTWV